MNAQLVNEAGEVVGYKDRQTIDRQLDLLHSVLVIAKTADGVYTLSVIPIAGHLPAFAGKLGASAATFLREGETIQQAAVRACSEDLDIDAQAVIHLGDRFYEYVNGMRRFVSAFSAEIPRSKTVLPDQVQAFSRPDIEAILVEEQSLLSPSLVALWNDYREVL